MDIQFPYNDSQGKVIALLGYTGVGKTSFITAAYFENIIYGKDAFTQRFFQRIEEEIQRYGQIPLTMGDASTLSFIEPQSRNEFTIQDFSGEHIKLERKKEKHYQELLTRADNAHALVCMLSAASFYRSTRIQEEVDAVQTFVNELRALGARIPVVIVLTKCDTVPRFYINFPILKTICAFISALPFLRLPPSRGLELTRRRFPTIFSGLDFKDKGPRTVFLGIALPRLQSLKSWQLPKGFQWLGNLLRKFWVDPKFLFHKNLSLAEPFQFCFQAFQISILRNLLIGSHQEPEVSKKLLAQFAQSMIEKSMMGKEFYFKEYLDKILDDTKALIEEMQSEVTLLTQNANRLLTHDKELAPNLALWLDSADDKVRKFNKPWSEGARKTLESLRHTTILQIRDRIAESINKTLEETGANTFYRLIEILRLRRDVSRLDIWAKEAITLPEVESFQQRLLYHFIQLVLSKGELAAALYQEDRSRYQEALTIQPPHELTMLDRLVEAGAYLQKNLGQLEVGAGDWKGQVLEPFKKVERAWQELAKSFDLSPACTLRTNIENKVLHSLEREAANFKSLGQVLEWAAEVAQLVHCQGSEAALHKVVDIAGTQSDTLRTREISELSARAKRWQGTGKQLPARLKEWFDESEKRRDYLKSVAGSKGLDSLSNLQKEVFSEARDFLSGSFKATLEESRQKMATAQGDRGAFVQLVETLHIAREVEISDIFSRYGLALPPTADLEKNLFQNLTLLTLNRSGLAGSLYEEDKALFLGALRGSSPPYLKSLDTLVLAFDNLKKGGKEIAALPIAEWENRILSPMRSFHQSWLELAGQFALPPNASTRQEAERIGVRSLQDHAAKLTLRQLRDWVGTLYSLLQHPENQETLDTLLRGTEGEIRSHFQGDLEEFMARCQELTKAAQTISVKAKGDSQLAWQKFAGSVQTLAYSAHKFPHTELSLDAKIQNILEHAGPQAFQTSLEAWLKFLETNKRATRKWCLQLSAAIGQVRTIFQRPEAFMAFSDHLEQKLARFARRKTLWLRLAATLGMLLALAALSWGSYWYYTQAPQGIERFLASQVALRSDLTQLDRLAQKLGNENLTEAEFQKVQKNWESLVAPLPPKPLEIWIGLRASQLLERLRRMSAAQMSQETQEWWSSEIQKLQHLVEQLRKQGSMPDKSPILQVMEELEELVAQRFNKKETK